MRRLACASSAPWLRHCVGAIVGIVASSWVGTAWSQPAVPVRALSPMPGNLEGKWAFRADPEDAGRKSGWQRPEVDDAAWEQLRVPGYWEPQGITQTRPGQGPKTMEGIRWTDYDGIAWYRLRFTVPPAWAKEELLLRLGSVDDTDHAYLNGQLIGQTGADMPRSVSVQRQYSVPVGIVRAGTVNVLAVRVVDSGGPGGLMGPLVSLLPRSILEKPMQLPTEDRPLAERFANPPAATRILKIVHALPDAPEQQSMLLLGLANQGFGGIVTNVSFTNYLEDESKWEAFVAGVKKAKAGGMALWLYDEKGYPSGTAGGLTLRDHPEWVARGLLIADQATSGDAIDLPVPPGDLRVAAAYPVTADGLDLDRAVDLRPSIRDGKAAWVPQRGTWHAFLITESPLHEGTHAEISLALKLPYINLLMPEPTARFLELTHGGYARHLGKDLGKTFAATFTDEPSLMSRFFRRMPYRVLPWSPAFPAEFKRRCGYEIEELLPALVADCPATARTRYDFWNTVGDLVADNFFGQIQTWCREHGLPSGGHLLLEEPLLDHVAFYGDFFRCVRRLDAPSIDCLTSIPSRVPWRIARMISSAAELDGNTLTMCETSDHVQRHRAPGDKRPPVPISEGQIRGTVNRLLLGGINTITSYYSFSGLPTEQLRRLNEWTGRCGTMLKGGHQVADIAVLYPVHSVWPRFQPARVGPTHAPKAVTVQRVFEQATDTLYNARRDFTFVDARTLAASTAAGGALRFRDSSWRVLVLPCADTLPVAAWEGIERFWQSGGAVIALSALPSNSATRFPDPAITDLATRIFGRGDGIRALGQPNGGLGIYLPGGTEALLATVLGSVLEPDVAVDPTDVPIRMTHRRIDGRDVYFLINDSSKETAASVRFAATGAGTLWDPASGTSEAMGGTASDLRLGPYGAALVSFDQARARRRYAADAATIPRLVAAPLVTQPPTEGHGKFVDGQLVSATADGGVSTWRATATLTKGAVDTHLFVSFRADGLLDLSRAEALRFETSIPAGQRTSSQLLVLAHERGGAIYVAHSGRSLAGDEHVTSYVPWSSFGLAGWSKDADGDLDRSQVESISIGWGGYFGTEKEKVIFTVSQPQTVRIQAGAPRDR
ncbi:MAG: hypothetical protein HN380_17470 [Victivallales bacterium]|nr:hypothetical protein [Victivallales bacterium]